MKGILFIIVLFSSCNLWSQFTIINEFNFESRLISMGLDGTIDGKVLTANIDTLTVLDLSSAVIDDPTGLEDFIALKELDISYNDLINIDLTQNINLEILNCEANDLVSLNVTQNTSLRWLSCSSNDISSLNVTQNLLLDTLLCHGNLLTTLNVTLNPALRNLICFFNQISSLDLSQNSLLENLDFEYNLITSLNVNGADSLRFVRGMYNQIGSIDFSQNQLLERLLISNNLLTDLDLSQNHALSSINCSYNLLTCLNVKNGNNSNISYFGSNSNANLLCIEVDDINYSTLNWPNIDAFHFFDNNCTNNCSTVGIEENNFGDNLTLYPNPTDGNFSIDLRGNYQTVTLTITDVVGKAIQTQTYNENQFLNLKLEEPAGIYMLFIESGNKNSVIRLVKE